MSFLLLFALLSLTAAAIDQTPDVIIMEGDATILACSQVQTSHTFMYWYKQEKRREAHSQFQLVAFTSQGSSGESAIEEAFKKHFKTTGMKSFALPLSLENARGEDTGTYYCASQEAGGLSDRLYFGQGTRLTVLEEGHNVTHPKVTIFSPSKSELEKHRKATIVCLATDFYPDHVILTWYLNNNPIADGIKTEEPKYENKKYSLISRLRITAKQWQNSKNNFTCKVDFYSSSGSRSYEASIIGEECDSQASTNELYLRQANLGKLVYILLIFKSALYGAFIMHLKIRKKFCGN